MGKNPINAERLAGIKPSGIRRVFVSARGVQGVISLGVGEPDFSPPPHVLEAVKCSLDEGKTHYAPSGGIPELREALARKAMLDYGLSYDPESEILITVGGIEAVFLALMSFVNPGDEVLVPDPSFVCYTPGVLMTGGVNVPAPLREENGFKLTSDVVMSHITDRSRMIIINSPNNPTGSVLSYNDIAEIAKVAVERDLIVISDEVYEKITYDDAKHYCLATFPGMRERTLVVNSFSKTYAMTGFRVGYVLGPKELISSMMLIHQYSVACVNGPSQYGALEALKGPQNFVKDMVREFDRRRRFVYARLSEMENVSCSFPKGAFYVFPNIKGLGVSSERFVDYVYEKAKVVTVPGTAFGKYGEGYVRVSYATAYDQLVEAMNRIERVLKELKAK